MASSADSAHPPKTLLEWRMQQNQPEGAYPRDMWTPLEPFFLSHGYTLWIKFGPKDGDSMILRAPDETPRAPDPFVYEAPYNRVPPTYDMTLLFSKVGYHLLFLLHKCPY
jgi:hypothetical protein